MPSDERQFLRDLRLEIETELKAVESKHPEDAFGVGQEEWLFDPTDIEREEVGLRNLLGAVEAIEDRPVESEPPTSE